MIRIRKGKLDDLDDIMSCYDAARQYMRQNGNHKQWTNGYPSRDLIIEDINNDINYVGIDKTGIIVMAFAFIIGEDPTYTIIENGKWLNDLPYGTIHRLGSTGKHHGILRTCVKYCLSLINNIRLDTHADNTIMQNAVNKLGFTRCGIIYCRDSTPRIAFQKYNE